MTGKIRRRFVPPTDIIELDDRLLIVAEIAGMQPDDFSITLFNRRLVISGARRPTVDDFKALHRLEIGYGEFRIEVSLPWSADGDQVIATYRDGFLQVELPRLPEVNVPVIDVGATTREEHND